ncbi:hypothetical protein FOL47_007403, partial [Perkinsus chesapeaki]
GEDYLCCSNGCGHICKRGVSQEEYNKLADFDNRPVTAFTILIGFNNGVDMDEISASLNSGVIASGLSLPPASVNLSLLRALRMATIKVKTSNQADAEGMKELLKSMPEVAGAVNSTEIEWTYAEVNARQPSMDIEEI